MNKSDIPEKKTARKMRSLYSLMSIETIIMHIPPCQIGGVRFDSI